MKLTHIFKSILVFVVLSTLIIGQSSTSKEIKRLNAKINREKVRIDSLETEIRILLPDLRNTLHATVKAKQQTDSVAIMLINRMNTLQKKINVLEDNVSYIDSTNFEILAQLVMIENKIITLTSSFTEMYSLKTGTSSPGHPQKISPAEYKKKYNKAKVIIIGKIFIDFFFQIILVKFINSNQQIKETIASKTSQE